MKTYIISRDDYMGVTGGMERVTHETLRDVILELLGMDADEAFDEAVEMNGRFVHNVKEMADAELLSWFNDANGDGQQYVTVWCVEDDKQVLG